MTQNKSQGKRSVEAGPSCGPGRSLNERAVLSLSGSRIPPCERNVIRRTRAVKTSGDIGASVGVVGWSTFEVAAAVREFGAGPVQAVPEIVRVVAQSRRTSLDTSHTHSPRSRPHRPRHRRGARLEPRPWTARLTRRPLTPATTGCCFRSYQSELALRIGDRGGTGRADVAPPPGGAAIILEVLRKRGMDNGRSGRHHRFARPARRPRTSPPPSTWPDRTC